MTVRMASALWEAVAAARARWRRPHGRPSSNGGRRSNRFTSGVARPRHRAAPAGRARTTGASRPRSIVHNRVWKPSQTLGHVVGLSR
jgi:hypothetical protein